MSPKGVLLAAAILCLAGTTPAFTQTVAITGTVIDAEESRPIAGASIVVRGTSRGSVTDKNGRYTIDGVTPGTYAVECRSVGFLADTQRVVVRTGGRTTVDFTMRMDPLMMHEVVVRARADRETDAAARNFERTSPTVTNVLSAEAIQRSPDVTAAEAVKRIPGISITRVRGEARDAIVRGMEAKYNNTLVDGIRIPSPAENTRVVSLDFLPSELLQRVEVTKVLTPDMEADAIGGTVNFVMRNAPVQSFLRARVGTGYGSMLANNDFIGFSTDSIADDPLERFGQGYRAKPSDFPFDNARLIRSKAPPNSMVELTAGTRLFDDRLGILVGGSMRQDYQLSDVVRNYEAIDADNNTYFVHSEWRLHSHSKTKYGVNLKSDYVFDRDNQIEASVVGLFRHNRESRILSDTGEIFVPTLLTQERSVFQQHTILSAGLNGTHGLGTLNLKWRGGWAYAQQYKPDRAEVTTSQALIGDSIVSQRYIQGFDRDWQRNTDRDYFGGIDLTWKGLADQGITIIGGTFGRFKKRENDMNAYRLLPIPDSVTGDLPVYTGLEDLELKVANVGGTPEYSNNNYSASENIIAGYAQAGWESGAWHVLAGARVEMTDAEYSTRDVYRRAVLSATKTYSDILPSLHLRYALSESQNLRLSVGRSMSRPNYFDLVPYNYIGEDTRRRGNPELKRAISTNVDLRYETYPSAEDRWQFSGGVFYKKIDDPIETSLDLSNPSLPLLIPKNLGTANNFGFEVVAGMEVLDYFSLLANYTFTHSAITSNKIRFNRQSGTTEQVPEERALQGQSEHVANFSLGYNNGILGTMAQLNLVFTGERVARVSPYPNLDHIQTDYLTMDFSIEQHIWNNFSMFIHALNLLDTPYEVRIENGELIESERFGRQVSLGITYRTK